ncbi:AT-rich interactive domain-containing protein 4B isoform X3 [Culex pipiens pallens]|uniref:AT-rich interactive domain-containing protein 4B isoform X3 n=1 Tax=Culex pipiens pallens TaxID=42434 RepID=UPI0022AA45E8|nr:AT-rich interactive domain-containing protein 4B isoform X3 [Culex pipiens pallens]
MQQVDDPPYLTVGTEVSAKYKGAFCEAKVRKVVRNIKCKVAYKQTGLGSGVVSDEQIKGALRVGASVEVRHPERKEYVEATLTKIQDCSQYTVVFDDGDITTLRRSALCLKSGRHFNESETLDQLPLTHPEHFGNPVIGGRRGRRSRHLLQDDSSDEDDEPASSSRSNVAGDKEEHIGKVVCVETSDNKKKNPKENWFPGLVVAPTAQDQVRIRIKDEYLVRSFKDGRYYTVPKKEASDFTRDSTNKSEAAAVSAALDFMDNDTLPPHWDREVLFGNAGSCSDSEQELETDSSDDEPTEEKDHFVAQLYKFMDDRGTPLNKVPSIINRDVNLYRLFRAVQKLNGYNRVTSQNQWKQIALRLGFSPATASITNLVKQAYKKFLFSFEEFNRKLGCTMVPHPRTNRTKGRSLVRASSVQSPKTTEKDKPSTSKASTSAAIAAAQEAASSSAVEESGSESSAAETPPTSTAKQPPPAAATSTKRKLSGAGVGKVKALVDKFEEKEKEREKEKEKEKEKSKESVKKQEEPAVKKEPKTPKQAPPPPPVKAPVESEKRGRKRKETDSTDSKKDEKDSGKGSSGGVSNSSADGGPGGGPGSSGGVNVAVDAKETKRSGDFPIEVGDKLKVYYDEQKVTYEAKVIEIAMQEGNPIYLVHYTGWNTRYDEWVRKERIAENLTNSKNTKKSKSERNSSGPPGSSGPTTPATTPKASKRIRGNSKGDITATPTTTTTTTTTPGSNPVTPSTSASSSQRNKSPASAPPGHHRRPVTRGGHPHSSSRRRTSNNTDISSLSIATDDNTSDDSEDSDSVPIKKCPTNTNSSASSSSSTSSSSSLSSSSTKVSTTAEAGSSSEAAAISADEFSNGASKGRDYDLNQIRSELKGFKELKSPASPASDSTATANTEGVTATASSSSPSKDQPEKKAVDADDVSTSGSPTTTLKEEPADIEEDIDAKSTESETLCSEEDSSQSSNKAFSSSPITAMVDSEDTAPEAPVLEPVTSATTVVAASTVSSTVSVITSPVVKSTTVVKVVEVKSVEKEKPPEKVVKAVEEKAGSMPVRPPLKTYGTEAAIRANAEKDAVKFAFSTIIRETEPLDALPPIPVGGGAPSTSSAVVTSVVKEVAQVAPVISKPSQLLHEDKPKPQPIQRGNPSAFASTSGPAVKATPAAPLPAAQPPPATIAPPLKSTKLINVQDEIVATVINKSAIAAATTATAVSAALSSTIPGTASSVNAPAVPVPVATPTPPPATTTSTTTLAALRAEKKLTGDKKVEKVIPLSKLAPSSSSATLLPTEKKLSSSTLTPAQNKLLSKEALSIKSIFESSAAKLDDKITDVYEFKDVEFDLEPKGSAVTGAGTPRKLVSDVPQAEVVSSLIPALLVEEKKVVGLKKGPLVRKADPLALVDKKVKKPSPIKETDKLKLVRREKERDPEKEKLLLSELEGAAASFSSTMTTTPEKSSPHFAGFSSASATKIEHSFDVLRKSPNFNVAPHRDEKEEVKPEPAKLATVTKGIFTPVMSPTGLECTESIKSPLRVEEKVKEEPTLENCKKYFNDMNFEFDAPKVEKPPSIADKVLKALSQQQQQQAGHASTVKTEFPKYIIPTPVHKHHPTPSVSIEPVIASSVTPIPTAPLKFEATNFAAVIPIIPVKTILPQPLPLTEPPKIELPNIILKKEIDLSKTIPVVATPLLKIPSTFTAIKPEILPPTTCTKSQDLTESIKKLETSNLVQAESSRFTHHDEDSTDSNDSEHRLVIEDPEALDHPSVVTTPNQQTDFEKLIKVEVEEKPHISHVDMHSAASAAAVAAVACKEKLVYKTEPPPVELVKDESKPKPASILETIIQSELNTAASRGIGSQGYLKLKDQQDSFAQNELERLRREEQLQQQQQQQNQPPPSNPTPQPAVAEPADKKAPDSSTGSTESLSLLLCEETIPGSPAPVCGVSSAAAQKESTKVYAETGSSFLQPQNIAANAAAASDLKPVPMDLEPVADTTMNPARKAADTVDTPTSSPRDSVSQDENQEPDASPTKRRRQRKASEEPTIKRRRTAASGGGYGSRGGHRNVPSNAATDSEDNSDSMAFQRGASAGGNTSGAGGGSSSAASPAGGKSGRPCQYNFLVNLDPALNSAQRVAILKKKIQELRKTYNAIKAELASIDRRRKKLRRRERENKKQAKLAAAAAAAAGAANI